jgi:hypothetical protein
MSRSQRGWKVCERTNATKEPAIDKPAPACYWHPRPDLRSQRRWATSPVEHKIHTLVIHERCRGIQLTPGIQNASRGTRRAGVGKPPNQLGLLIGRRHGQRTHPACFEHAAGHPSHRRCRVVVDAGDALQRMPTPVPPPITTATSNLDTYRVTASLVTLREYAQLRFNHNVAREADSDEPGVSLGRTRAHTGTCEPR